MDKVLKTVDNGDPDILRIAWKHKHLFTQDRQGDPVQDNSERKDSILEGRKHLLTMNIKKECM